MPADNQANYAQKDDSPPVQPDLAIDITSYLCPMTFVRTRLALDRLQPGQLLSVRLRGEEPRTNVPRSVIEQGHRVIGLEEHADGAATLFVRKQP